MELVKKLLPFVCLLVHQSHGFENKTNDNNRQKKVLSVFQVVKFPNTACDSSTSGRNGTCYTGSECSSKGGSPSGTCASSFGVCCVFEASCGTTRNENNTYFTSSDRTLGAACIYTVCKSSSDVCKLRLDFETFVMNNAVTLTDSNIIAGGTTSILTGAFSDRGRCRTDTFGVTSPGNPSIPIICGTNTGYHMYVPASDQCNKLSGSFGSASTATTDAFTIKVSQIQCSSATLPPDDCLQYHTTDTGTLESFNYDSGNAVHLADQEYQICLRQGRGNCAICYYTPDASFGISVANGMPAVVGLGTNCGQFFPGNTAHVNGEGIYDHLVIQDGICAPTISGTSATTVPNDLYCGLAFECPETAAIAGTPANTVCTNKTPFKVGVHFDGQEAMFPAAGGAAEGADTANGIGFQLQYWQRTDCVIRP